VLILAENLHYCQLHLLSRCKTRKEACA